MKKRRDLPVIGSKAPGSAAAVLDAVSGSTTARIAVVTLGCDKNTVDSERVMAQLAGSGADVGASVDDADVIVINTCGFIETAKEESIEAILDAVRLKQEGRVRAVVAMGCMVQRYKKDLEAEIPEVDAFLGLTEIQQLPSVLRQARILPEAAPLMERPLRLLSTETPHTSYLKISEGCDHTCAFCAIPLMRGKHRSTPIERLVAEAGELADRGVVELNIVSQDTTWYGRDLQRGIEPGADDFFVGRMAGDARPRAASPAAGARHGLLPELLQSLLAETNIPWLRLFYLYPSGIRQDLVNLIAREPRIARYIDMPIQHGADRILTAMRRPERAHTIRERVAWLREAVPDIALRTTVIAGFPGETDEDFEAMLNLLEELRFDHVGAFTYSVEEDTLAATMADQVPDDIKRERLERIMDLQRAIAQEKNDARIGTTVRVLIDRVNSRTSQVDGTDTQVSAAVGRAEFQAVEVDGVVHIPDATGLRPGDFIDVRITEAIDQDLVGVAEA